MFYFPDVIEQLCFYFKCRGSTIWSNEVINPDSALSLGTYREVVNYMKPYISWEKYSEPSGDGGVTPHEGSIHATHSTALVVGHVPKY